MEEIPVYEKTSIIIIFKMPMKDYPQYKSNKLFHESIMDKIAFYLYCLLFHEYMLDPFHQFNFLKEYKIHKGVLRFYLSYIVQ